MPKWVKWGVLVPLAWSALIVIAAWLAMVAAIVFIYVAEALELG